MDVSKVFDFVHNRFLLLKSQDFGIGGRLLKWVGEALIRRMFCIPVRQASSSTTMGNTGASLGLVLDPLLFPLLMNDFATTMYTRFPLGVDVRVHGSSGRDALCKGIFEV